MSNADGEARRQLAEAVQMLFGCAFYDSAEVRRACGWLKPEQLRNDVLAPIWQDVLDGQDIAETLIDTRTDLYLNVSQWSLRVESVFHAPQWANRIAGLNYVLDVGERLPNLARAVASTNPDTVAAAVGEVGQLSPTTFTVIPTMNTAMEPYIEGLHVLPRGIPTDIIGRVLPRLPIGNLSVLAARPSMGKSTFALQLAVGAARAKRKTVIFSLEMQQHEMIDKLVMHAAGICPDDVRGRADKVAELERVEQAALDIMGELNDHLIIIDHTPQSTEDVWRQVEQIGAEYVVIDHIGLLSDRSSDDNDVRVLGEITKRGKEMAKALKCHTMHIHQMSRANEARNDKRPIMSDLRGSGEIEQNADQIIFLHREGYYDPKKDKLSNMSETEVIIRKFRGGKANQGQKLWFKMDRQWFYPQEPESNGNGNGRHAYAGRGAIDD